MKNKNDYEFSLFREKFVEHRFLAEILELFWKKGIFDVEVLKSEIDNAGYDLIITYNNITNYIQLKSSLKRAKTSQQKVNIKLADKKHSSVIWVIIDDKDETIEFEYRIFIPKKNEMDNFETAKHSKGNAEGVKKERPNIKIVKKAQFEEVSLDGIIKKLFKVKK
jgi:hypothetical protein